MVYFNSIIDETVKTFTSTVNVNKTYSLEDITTSDYWSVEDVGTTLRCVPLFHTEEISSSNPKDTVLDNKCVIAIEDADTLITCKSQPNLTITASDFNLYAYTLDNKRIYCIVTDKYNNLITNTEIEVYNGNTLQTTVKTGTNGICKHTTSSIGSYKFVLDNEESNSLFVGGVLSLSADTSIIETGDTATVTASLTESGVGVSGETLSYTIKHGSTVLDSGSDTTDNNGEIEITYTGTGVGDVTITVDYSGALQETCTIEDCKYWNDGTSVGSLEIPSGATVTSDGEYLTIGATSSEKLIYIPVTLANTDNWEYSVKVALKQDNKCIALIFNDNSYYMSSDSSNGKYYYYFTLEEYPNVYSATNDVIHIRRQNGVTKLFVNDTEYASKNVSHKTSFKCGFYTFNKPFYVDEIKIKAL